MTEKFLEKINVLDTWLHGRILEPIAAWVCCWLKISRRDLMMWLFALFSVVIISAGFKTFLSSNEQTTRSLFSLFFSLSAVVLFGGLVFPLFKIGEADRLPVVIEVLLGRMKQLRPLINLFMIIALFTGPVIIMIQPEKCLIKILEMLADFFFLVFCHSLDPDDLLKS